MADKNSVTDWSETAGDNDNVGGVPLGENVMLPSNVNNAFRVMMAQLKAFFKSSVFRVRDGADETKLLAFDLSGLTTATTRTITVPDESAVMQTRVATTADNSIPRHDGVAGKLQTSTATIGDGGELSLVTTTTEGLTQRNTVSTSASTVDIVNNASNGLHIDVYGSAFVGSGTFAVGAGGVAIYSEGLTAYGTTNAFDMPFYVNSQYAGRWVSSSRYFLVGATSSAFATVEPGTQIAPTGQITSKMTTTGGNTHLIVANNAGVSPTQVGSITSSGSATAYNTTSDEDLKTFHGAYDPDLAISVIEADPVRMFSWNINGQNAIGWGAQTSYAVSHDLATPGHGVPGDEDYRPWGVDMAKRTPYLWAAMARALQRISDLEDRLSTLEGREP